MKNDEIKCASQIYGYKKKKIKKWDTLHWSLVRPHTVQRCSGSGTSCITAVAHLTLHHHLSGNTTHVGHCRCIRDLRSSGWRQCEQTWTWRLIHTEKSQGHSLLLGQRAHALLLPEEEAGPPMTWILLWQPCRHIRTFSALSWSYHCQWSVMSVHSPVLI